MAEISGAVLLHPSERHFHHNNVKLLIDGCGYISERFKLRADRLKMRTSLDAAARRGAGLAHPVYGPMNAHLLKRKWRFYVNTF